jgi:hypothetical protein
MHAVHQHTPGQINRTLFTPKIGVTKLNKVQYIRSLIFGTLMNTKLSFKVVY